jgi:hypothetical protein
MPYWDLSGGLSIATGPQTLRWATDQMVETLGPETLKKLKVRAGEHLAALLTATFLLTPPTGIDTEGEVDLWFDLSRRRGEGMKPAPILPDGAASAAFEIKSMPGPFREYDSSIDRDRARGIDAFGRSLTAPVQAASDVLRETGPVLRRAREQLHRKTSAEASRNIFLVIHLFDYFVAECMRPSILGPLLDPLPDIEGVDTVWVLWPLEHLTIWSNEQRAWTDLLFNEGDPEAETAPDEMDALLGPYRPYRRIALSVPTLGRRGYRRRRVEDSGRQRRILSTISMFMVWWRHAQPDQVRYQQERVSPTNLSYTRTCAGASLMSGRTDSVDS